MWSWRARWSLLCIADAVRKDNYTLDLSAGYLFCFLNIPATSLWSNFDSALKPASLISSLENFFRTEAEPSSSEPKSESRSLEFIESARRRWYYSRRRYLFENKIRINREILTWKRAKLRMSNFYLKKESTLPAIRYLWVYRLQRQHKFWRIERYGICSRTMFLASCLILARS